MNKNELVEVNTENTEVKKEGFVKKTKKKIKKVAKKVWPFVLGGAVAAGLGLFYLSRKVDNEVEESEETEESEEETEESEEEEK